jgi:hypothetical protein
MLAALARIEALLRAVHRDHLESGFPPVWAKGRRRKILDYCSQPRGQQAIRDHVRSIAGDEVKQYLDEALRIGLLAAYGEGEATRYVAVLAPPRQQGRTKSS